MVLRDGPQSVECAFNLASADRLLGLEHGVDAFGRDDQGALLLENKRRVLAGVDYDVQLLANDIHAVDNEGAIDSVSLRQILGKQPDPDRLAGVAFCDGMADQLPDLLELQLDIAVKPGEQALERPGGHVTISRQYIAASAAITADRIACFSAAVRSSEMILLVLAGSTAPSGCYPADRRTRCACCPPRVYKTCPQAP